MIEGTPREPHERLYQREGVDGTVNNFYVPVDNMGSVLMSEELVDLLLLELGFQEVVE